MYQNHPLAGARDLDTAMGRLWDFYKKYFVGLYIISLASALLSAIISSSLDVAALQSMTDPEEIFAALGEMALPYTGIIAISFILGLILHAYILERPGEGFSVSSMTGKAAIAFFPCLAVMIILGIAASLLTAIGMILLILPGLFALVYSVTIIIFVIPVTLAESRNPGTIISRSLRLSHRNLWPNMGWLLVIVLILMVLSFIIAALVMLPFTGSFIKAFADPEEAAAIYEMAKNPLYIVVSSVTSAFLTPVIPILAFVLYFRNSSDTAAEDTPAADDNRVRVEDLYPRTPGNE